jgi:hypothetical protein
LFRCGCRDALLDAQPKPERGEAQGWRMGRMGCTRQDRTISRAPSRTIKRSEPTRAEVQAKLSE